MDKRDIIKQMKRFPDVINPAKRMMAKTWKCSTCGRIYKFEAEHSNPAPCIECDGIFFETVR